MYVNKTELKLWETSLTPVSADAGSEGEAGVVTSTGGDGVAGTFTVGTETSLARLGPNVGPPVGSKVGKEATNAQD